MSTIWNANIGFYFESHNSATPKKVTFMPIFWSESTAYHISFSFLDMAAICDESRWLRHRAPG